MPAAAVAQQTTSRQALRQASRAAATTAATASTLRKTDPVQWPGMITAFHARIPSPRTVGDHKPLLTSHTTGGRGPAPLHPRQVVERQRGPIQVATLLRVAVGQEQLDESAAVVQNAP